MGIRGFFWKGSEFLKARNLKPLNVIAGQDGQLYEVRDNPFGRLVTKKTYVRELEEIKPGFQYRLPKISGDILTQVLSFFRTYCTDWEQNEVMVQLYYDRETQEYIVECPYQKVNKVHIDAEYDTEYMHNDRYVRVMHIHSHNSMEAYFSITDDENEKAFMLYAVVGRLQDDEPQMKLRVGCNGEFISLPLDYIFENPTLTPTDTSYPEEWDDRVQIVD
ncbi:PRTRC genetic system protein A [Evansella vedderi]|uniref:PRTRC genetic system protein A n=1 Tax=Evansella vedderi TaxID=38282 RepID=A0ABT9ZX95_9BACI|nr:hypothetical protein [Evansella vedderi]MDQ0255560.1 PRTRC genetic system protein A [Evansella vedderi]